MVVAGWSIWPRPTPVKASERVTPVAAALPLLVKVMRNATAWVEAAEEGDEVTTTDTGLVPATEDWAVTATSPKAMVATTAPTIPARRVRDDIRERRTESAGGGNA